MPVPLKTAASAAYLAAAALLSVTANAQAPQQPAHRHRFAPAEVNAAPTNVPQVISGVSRNYTVSPEPGAPYRNKPASLWSSQGTRATAQSIAPPILPLLTSLIAFGMGPATIQGEYAYGGAQPSHDSGRVTAIAADPHDPNTFYVGAAGGGVWKTSDGGLTYIPLTDDQPCSAIGAVAVAPSSRFTLYVGTGEGNNSGDSRSGVGILKSTDGGQSWTVIPGPSNAFVRKGFSKIAISPTNPNVVYAAVTNAGSGVRGNTGIWKTTDGGTTWKNTTVTNGLSPLNYYEDVAVDPTNPNQLYAAIGLGFSTQDGVYTSPDGGNTWTIVDASLPSGKSSGRSAVVVDNTGAVYVSMSTSLRGSAAPGVLLGLYASAAGGVAWTNLNAPNYIAAGQGWYDNAVAVSPINPKFIYGAGMEDYHVETIGKNNAIVGTTDGGTTWFDMTVGQYLAGPHTDHHALAWDAAGRLLDGNDGGVWRLENASLNTNPTVPRAGVGLSSNIQWSNLNGNLSTVQFTGVALDPFNAKIAYGGAQDNGTSKFTAAQGWVSAQGGDGGFTRVNQFSPNIVYATYTGISLQISFDGGANFQSAVGGINLKDLSEGDLANFYMPYILDPADQTHVLVGTNNLYESFSYGLGYNMIAAFGVNGFNPSKRATDAIAVNGNTYYVSAGGSLFASTGGTNWNDVTPAQWAGKGGLFGDLFVSPSDATDAYTVCSTFNGAGTGHVFHTTNGGTSWDDISGNLPDEPFNAIKIALHTGTIYVGGDDGVYYSNNVGQSWARLGTGLPKVQVVDLTISNDTGLLGVGTHGRGLWEYQIAAPNFGKITLTNLAVTRSGPSGALVAKVTFNNPGTGINYDLQIANITLGGNAPTSPATTPINLGPQPAGKLITTSVTFPSLPKGSVVQFQMTATNGNGDAPLKSTVRVTIP